MRTAEIRAPVSLALLLAAAAAALCVAGVAVGSLGWEPLWGRAGDASAAILWDIRLPRTLGAWLDEPLANLDPPHQSDWLRIVRGHVLGGGTAISVLHEITMALHADDLVVMNAGQIVHQGDCAHSATHRALEQVFDNRVAVRHVADRWVALLQSGWAKGPTTP